MYNECLFLTQLLFILGSVILALRAGKEALVTWFALGAILANLFVLKQIDLFGFHVTCSDAYVIGAIISLNLIQEHWGQSAAKKTIWIGFAAMAIFSGLSQLHLLFSPNAFDVTQNAFKQLLCPTPRLLGASLFTFLIVQFVDIKVFGRLSKALPAMPFAWRSGTSMILTQLLDTVMFSFLGLYGIVESLPHIVLISFTLKIGIISCSTLLLTLLKKWTPSASN